VNRQLDKLVLQVAHVCNLACPYCSSDRGRWGSKATALMSARTATSAIRGFARQFDGVGVIYFFGGEPTLNLDAIEASLDCIEDLLGSGELPARPNIGMTSNGYQVSQRLIDMLRERPLGISVSIDGPPEINDALRPTVDGGSSTNCVMENIRTLKSLTGQPGFIELTYTSLHLDKGFRLFDTLEYLHEHTGVNRFVVTPAYDVGYRSKNFDSLATSGKAMVKEMDDALRQSIRQMSSRQNPIVMYTIFSYIGTIMAPSKPELCPAGSTFFAVAYDGSVYPCQNLPETKETALGNVSDIPGMMKRVSNLSIVKDIQAANTSALIELADAWYAAGCKVCPATNRSETGSMACHGGQRFSLHAQLRRAFSDELIDLAADQGRYERFLDNCKRFMLASAAA
jgi:uncharacterized protein